jgi:hypothetical protein
MAMNHTQALKHQWQSKKPDTHRVRFFTSTFTDDVDTQMSDRFWRIAEEFKLTPQAEWVKDNDITLAWMEDDIYYSFGKMCIIYGDLTERQYVDYSLRFFQHQAEWK